jgi:hypothetical protein
MDIALEEEEERIQKDHAIKSDMWATKRSSANPGYSLNVWAAACMPVVFNCRSLEHPCA